MKDVNLQIVMNAMPGLTVLGRGGDGAVLGHVRGYVLKVMEKKYQDDQRKQNMHSGYMDELHVAKTIKMAESPIVPDIKFSGLFHGVPVILREDLASINTENFHISTWEDMIRNFFPTIEDMIEEGHDIYDAIEHYYKLYCPLIYREVRSDHPDDFLSQEFLVNLFKLHEWLDGMGIVMNDLSLVNLGRNRAGLVVIRDMSQFYVHEEVSPAEDVSTGIHRFALIDDANLNDGKLKSKLSLPLRRWRRLRQQ